MSSQLLASCPKCGSTNVVRHISGEFECLSCGYKWGEGRRYGHPRTEEERRERHKERYGTEELPPRGRRIKQEGEIERHPESYTITKVCGRDVYLVGLPDWNLVFVKYETEDEKTRIRRALLREGARIYRVTDQRIYFEE